MRILYAALKYDYNDPARGLSFEHYNFFHSLRQMGCDLLYFDYGTLLNKYGRRRMNRRLWEVVKAEMPNLLFVFLSNEELDKRTVRRISDDGRTITLNWFADDHYRFDIYSRHWAPCFRWIVTTAHSALPKYEAAGIRHVIPSQWACNTRLYRKLDLPKKYDVTFVGTAHGVRRGLIRHLRQRGIDVRWWGLSSDNGRLSHERMIQVFNESRISLNFVGATVRTGRLRRSPVRWRAAVKQVARFLPFGDLVVRHVRQAAWGGPSPQQIAAAIGERQIPQIKGRTFEIPGCGTFMLTGHAENLDEYFTAGREIDVFHTVDHLVEKVRYYLTHEDEREQIARCGYERCIHEHTYERRFREIFGRMGLPLPAGCCDDLSRPQDLRGTVEEVA